MLIKEAATKLAAKLSAYRLSASWKSHLKQFCGLWGDREVLSLSSDEVNVWSLARRQVVAAQTVAAEQSVLAMLLEEGGGKLDRSRIVPLRINNARLNWLNEQAERTLKQRLPVEDYEMLRFAVLTGLRKVEQFRLRVRDICRATSTISIETSKTGIGSREPICKEALKIALKQCAGKKGSDYLWFAAAKGSRITLGTHFVAERMRTHFDAVIGRHFQWRDLRHTFASRLVQADVSLYVVQKLMRHKTPNMTQRYAHLNDRSKKDALATFKALT